MKIQKQIKMNLTKRNVDKRLLSVEKANAGFAENLYSKDWLKTAAVPISEQGSYAQMLPAVEAGKEYQYRAVIVHPRLTGRGDVKRVMVKAK